MDGFPIEAGNLRWEVPRTANNFQIAVDIGPEVGGEGGGSNTHGIKKQIIRRRERQRETGKTFT